MDLHKSARKTRLMTRRKNMTGTIIRKEGKWRVRHGGGKNIKSGWWLRVKTEILDTGFCRFLDVLHNQYIDMTCICFRLFDMWYCILLKFQILVQHSLWSQTCMKGTCWTDAFLVVMNCAFLSSVYCILIQTEQGGGVPGIILKKYLKSAMNGNIVCLGKKGFTLYVKLYQEK